MNKEQVNQEIAELKNKIAELEKKLEGKLEIGQYYYYVDYTQHAIGCKQYRDSDLDICNIEYGNLYAYTEEGEKQAERNLFEFELIQKLKKFARENVCAGDCLKYGIYYNYNDGKLRAYSILKGNATDIDVYYTSREIAQKAIEKYKEELIRYFTEEE